MEAPAETPACGAMNNSASIGATSAIAPDLGGHDHPGQSPNHPDHPEAEERPPSDQADYRLVIEEDKAAGSLLYKTIDRRTGDVVAERPSDEVAELGRAPDYVAGAVIKTRA
jgi:flagellar protein FlaG